MTKIAIIDDDREILELLNRLFVEGGYRVVTVNDSRDALPILADSLVDLVILDLMMPGIDGLTLCKAIRERHADMNIIMLTARDDEIDRVLGLELGADDYVTKPFSGRELLARVKAVLRRAGGAAAPQQAFEFRFGTWRFRPADMELIDDSDELIIPLSTSETELLLAFVRNPGVALSREKLGDLTRRTAALPFGRSIDTQVSRLRRKLGDEGKHPQFIRTIWGRGYIFTAQVASQ